MTTKETQVQTEPMEVQTEPTFMPELDNLMPGQLFDQGPFDLLKFLNQPLDNQLRDLSIIVQKLQSEECDEIELTRTLYNLLILVDQMPESYEETMESDKVLALIDQLFTLADK